VIYVVGGPDLLLCDADNVPVYVPQLDDGGKGGYRWFSALSLPLLLGLLCLRKRPSVRTAAR
jgi:hypothetical protein